MQVAEDSRTWALSLKARVGGYLPYVYSETFNKDNTYSSSYLRRDMRPGKNTLQMFYTDEGILVLR